LSGIAQIWPDAAKEIPREVIEPFVAFEAGRIRTAARLESKGWRAVFGSDYGLELSSDKKQLIVRLHSAQCGAVTLPRFIVGSLARPYLRGQAAHGHTIDELYDGVPLENHFVWPNGRRPFRFKEITIEPGKIRLLIEPL